jgi:uracil-DNA glycosylase family 4
MSDNWDDVITSYDCPVCKRDDCVPAAGLRDSPILLVSEFPGVDEVKYGKPLCGASGGVLKAELAYLGVDMKRLRICNLWLHEPSKDKALNDKCLAYSAGKVIEEAKGKKAILLIGSDTVKYFTGYSVSKVAGLHVTSSYLSAPIIMTMPNPAEVFHGAGIGEVRLSLQKFAKEIEDLL